MYVECMILYIPHQVIYRDGHERHKTNTVRRSVIVKVEVFLIVRLLTWFGGVYILVLCLYDGRYCGPLQD